MKNEKFKSREKELCRKCTKYTLLRDRLNYKSTKMREKGEEENFGIFHVVFSTMKKGEKKGEQLAKGRAHIKRRVWKRWRGGAAVVLQTIHELARVASCHSRCSFPLRLSTLFSPLNDNLLTRLSAFFHGHSSKSGWKSHSIAATRAVEIRIFHFTEIVTPDWSIDD